jgi:hypothetical protein
MAKTFALARRERREDARARAEIHHAVAGPDMTRDRGVIKIHAHPIRQHPFLLMQIGKIPAIEGPVALLGRGGLFWIQPRRQPRPGANPGARARQATAKRRATSNRTTLKT